MAVWKIKDEIEDIKDPCLQSPSWTFSNVQDKANIHGHNFAQGAPTASTFEDIYVFPIAMCADSNF